MGDESETEEIVVEREDVDAGECGAGRVELFFPTVQDELKPYLKMEFESLHEGYDFYNNYALAAGFGIREHSSKKSMDGECWVRKEFVCCKQGKKRVDGNVTANKKGRRGDGRTECKAKLALNMGIGCEKYVVTVFNEGHNHSMSSAAHLFRSHRRVSEAKKAMIQQCAQANISISKQVGLLEVQSGGIGNIGCTPKDMYNAEQQLRGHLIGHDAEMLKEHFEEEKEKNVSFYFKMEIDEGGTLGNFFWADAKSRLGYGHFGDVIVFDTTFNTNVYGMMFAPLLGVNNHGQTTVLGCAFLKNEKTESFEWLFEEMLKAMPGEPPKVIITDQDGAIAKAIRTKLPMTFHRYCIWHIINKFNDKGWVEGLFKSLHDCIWDTESKEEFEARWKALVQENELVDKTWLQDIYELRGNWVPAFCKQYFSAGMSSSQRAESCHSFFKQYVHRKHSLIEFIIRFNRALGRQRDKEMVADHNDENRAPPLQLHTPMEAQMSKLYTRFMFEKFQVEELKSLTCFLREKSGDGNEAVYEVLQRAAGVTKIKRLVVDTISGCAKCSCKEMEFRGLPCRHILAYLRMKQVELLPERYILKRWLQTATSGMVLDAEGKEVGRDAEADNSTMSKRAKFSRQASQLIDKGVMSEEGTELLARSLKCLDRKLNGLSGGKLGRKRKHTEDGGKSSQSEVLKDPVQVKRKGAAKTSTKEKRSQNRRWSSGKKKSPRPATRSSLIEAEELTPATRTAPPGDLTGRNEAADADTNSMPTQNRNCQPCTAGNSGVLNDFYEYILNDQGQRV